LIPQGSAVDYSGYSEFLQRQSRAWQVQAIAGILMGRGFPMSCAALERGSANHHKFAKMNKESGIYRLRKVYCESI
jgi:hypothetical protein